jgi:hypothetical protein
VGVESSPVVFEADLMQILHTLPGAWKQEHLIMFECTRWGMLETVAELQATV